MRVERIENSIFNSNTWVLVQPGQGTWLVDCGDVDPLLAVVEPPLRGVLLTHVHFDHIYGLNALIDHFGDVPIFTTAQGREALLDEYENLSAYHDSPYRLPDDSHIRLIADGDTLPLFDDVEADVVATPGHNPTCLTFIVGDQLFTGDAYIPGVKVVTILPGGDKRTAAVSIDLILQLAKGRTIYPGHGNKVPAI